MGILSKPRGNAEEYGRWSVNPYLGCSNQCEYCYLKKGPGAKTLGGNVPTLKKGIVNEEHAYHVAMAEIIENRDQIIKDGGLFMTFTSDPCIKETRNLFFRIACDASLKHKIPVMMLTKAADFMFESFLGVYFEASQHLIWSYKKIAYGWTLTGHDELEPNAPSNKSRIEAMRLASKDSEHIWASIEPVITFDASFEMIQQALDAGCKHFKIGLMTKNTKVCRNGFSYGGHDFAPYDMVECCQFVGYVMELTERYGATVYWKQSFVDFLQVSKKDPQPVHGMTAREFLSQWPHSVGKDWSIFDSTKTI